jgi:hypothetical protein
MMHWNQALLGSCGACSVVLSMGAAHAQTVCRAGHGVDLTIELEPADVTARENLEQRLTAELRPRDLDVCALGSGQGRLAHVHVLAPLPALSPARLRVDTDAGAVLERQLDVSALPPEARASAIASAADELLSSLLQSTATSAARPATAPEDSVAREAVAGSPQPVAQLPSLELGVGGGAALFQHGQGYQGELLGRWRPFSRWSATVRVGADRGSSEINTRVSELNTSFDMKGRFSGWHVGLDAGFELLKPTRGVGLSAQAGLTLARVQRTQQWLVATPLDVSQSFAPAGSSWELASRVGMEASFHARSWGAALGLAALLPLTATSQPTPGLSMTGSTDVQQNGQFDAVSSPGPIGFIYVERPLSGPGEELGGELSLRLWLALDSSG